MRPKELGTIISLFLLSYLEDKEQHRRKFWMTTELDGVKLGLMHPLKNILSRHPLQVF